MDSWKKAGLIGAGVYLALFLVLGPYAGFLREMVYFFPNMIASLFQSMFYTAQSLAAALTGAAIGILISKTRK